MTPKTLYSLTGDIKDINTILVSRETLKDAERYQWLKMTAPPGQPLELFQKLHEALHMVRAYEVFTTSWTGWDAAIDSALKEQQSA